MIRVKQKAVIKPRSFDKELRLWSDRTRVMAAGNIMARAKHPTGRLASSLKSQSDGQRASVYTELSYGTKIEELYHYLHDAGVKATRMLLKEIKR